jgi:hypothetical protein
MDQLHDQRILAKVINSYFRLEFELQLARGRTACKVRNRKEEEKRLLKKQGVEMYNGMARLA